MKTHYMKLQPQPFEMIKNGKKDIEMRLNDEKRKSIENGDIIEFSNTSSGEIIRVSVISKHVFDSFDKLYASFDKSRLGYEDSEAAEPHDMSKYYEDAEIKNTVCSVLKLS